MVVRTTMRGHCTCAHCPLGASQPTSSSSTQLTATGPHSFGFTRS